MNKLILVLLFLTIALSKYIPSANSSTLKYEILPYNPTPTPENIVTCPTNSQARFTVLTDRVIRLEYDSNKTFLDNATLAIVNR